MEQNSSYMKRIEKLLPTLYIKVKLTAYEYCNRKRWDRATADDLIQDTFLAFYNNLERRISMPEPIEELNSYIVGILLHKIYDFQKRKKLNVVNVEDVDQLKDDYDNVESSTFNKISLNYPSLVDELLKYNPRLLTKGMKKLWGLYKLRKYSEKEIENLLKLSTSAFQSLKSRMFRRLVDAYKRLHEYRNL